MIRPDDARKLETTVPEFPADTVSSIWIDEGYLIDVRQPLELRLMADLPWIRFSTAHRFPAEVESI